MLCPTINNLGKLCVLYKGHTIPHEDGNGLSWFDAKITPRLCDKKEGIWECNLPFGHDGFHQTKHGSSWTDEINQVYIECSHINLYDSKFICTRVKGHEGPHENDKGAIWEHIEKEEVKEFSGVTSTKIPRFELIPFSALEALALIFEKGIEKKGDGAWNALTVYKEDALKDKLFVVERLSHVIKHCYKAIGKVMEGKEWEGEEDAGAILFGGSVLAEYKRLRRDAKRDS